jgi:protein-S-isoprenylcysteine O-methyltransferase Ste14
VPSAVPFLARTLFRLRSYTPLPLLVAVVAVCWRGHLAPGPGGEGVDAALNVVGVALAALGTVVRAATVGFEPRTNTQTRRLGAPTLFTEGPYQVMRHPLYLGNALIVLGLLCLVHQLEAWALAAPAFLLSTATIIRGEERLLQARFGQAWTGWAARVPGLSLDPRRWRAVRERPFDWRTAVRRETNPLVAWGLLAQAALGWEWWAREALTEQRTLALRLGMAVLLALLLLNKLWKTLRP